MWFKIISFILAGACFLKAFIGFVFHNKFYKWDREQYASKQWPKSFFIFVTYGLVMFLLIWYATIFHYVKFGWILTSIVTLSSVKLFSILFKRKKIAPKFVKLIDAGGWKLWAIDAFVLIMGILFLFMGTHIYLL